MKCDCVNYDEIRGECRVLTELREPSKCFAQMTHEDKIVSLGLCFAHHEGMEWVDVARGVKVDYKVEMAQFGKRAEDDFRILALSRGTTPWREFEKLLREKAKEIIKNATHRTK